MPRIDPSVVLVTGANGGIGSHLVRTALERGATKVYATARQPKTWDDERIVALPLDVTDPASIAAVVEAAPDVNVLINNAGSSVSTPAILEQSDDEIRTNIDTNLLGPLYVARAFVPVLTAHERSALVDIHSVLSWYALAGIYSAAKAGLWSVTNSLRVELAPRGVQVVGVHVGYVDTPMAAHASGPKTDPAEVAAKVFDALDDGELEVLVDDLSRQVKAALSGPVEALYPQVAPPA